MGFFRHALIGIGLYEGFKYLMRKDNARSPTAFAQPVPMVSSLTQSEESGTIPPDDPWKNSLADDALRAPDS